MGKVVSVEGSGKGRHFQIKGCLGPLLISDSAQSIQRIGVNTYQSAHPRKYWGDIIIASSAHVERASRLYFSFPSQLLNILIF